MTPEPALARTSTGAPPQRDAEWAEGLRRSVRSWRSAWWADAVLALMTFVAAGLWGTHYWNASRAAGRQGYFYEDYFEPAVMTACGRGFVVAQPPIQAVTEFLAGRRAVFDCHEIPADINPHFATFQAPWRYLMLSVAATWKARTISWGALGPLAGVLFGVAVAVMFGIFRLGMGRFFALAGAFSFAVGPIHLIELPHLRDYSKAPFALGCLLILGVMVTRTLRPRAKLALSALYGAVVGIGYGFRSDLLIYLPPFFLTVALFLPGGVTRNIKWKALAGVVCLAAFVFTSYPIVSVVSQNGSCLWHFTLLGLTDTFTENLRVVPGSYDWGHQFVDRWVYATLAAFSDRSHPSFGLIQYCSPVYDVVGREYTQHLAGTFPADILTRGVASILGILREAFWRPAPLPEFAPAVYVWRDRFLRHLPGTGFGWVIAAILTAVCADVRIGLFLLFVLIYFGGYPAIQFHPRHMFHLEFMPWWAIGFVVWQVGTSVGRSMMSRAWPAIEWPRVRRGLILAAGAGALFAVALATARVIHDGRVRRLFESYIGAAKSDLHYAPMTPGSLHSIQLPDGQRYPAAFLEIDFRTSACGPSPSVTVRYEPRPDGELSRTIVLEHSLSGVTRVFAPVYEFFQGLEFSDERPGCVIGVKRVTDLRPFPMLVNATLYPDWSTRPLHQRIGDAR